MGSSSSKPDSVQEQRVAASPNEKRSPTPDLQVLSRLSLAENDGTIDLASLDAWESDLSSAQLLARTILSKQDIFAALASRDAIAADSFVFNLKLSHPREAVCNQMQSGRCWLFATCNVARMEVIKRYKLPLNFELSQSYLFFYDHLEKSNFFLEQMLELADEPVDARIMQYLCSIPENDGGQWDMVCNLIERYGIVPKSLYPESFNSSNSSKVGSLLTSKMREYAVELRSLYKRTLSSLAQAASDKSLAEHKKIAVQVVRTRKTAMMKEVYQILTIACGKPPRPTDELTWEFEDTTGRVQSIKTTPLKFYAESCAPFKASENISLINDPRNPYDTLYTVDRLGNVWNGRPCLYVNTTAERMMSTVVDLLKRDLPVWFGCDVGKFENTAAGVMDTKLFDFEAAFGTSLGMNKAERILMGESEMTHAMVIMAAHVVDGKPVRFLVQNSWSDSVGDKGYFVMTADWFKEYVFQIVAPRGLVAKDLRAIFEEQQSNPTVLPCWDPFGSLAAPRRM